MYVRRKVFSVIEDEMGVERYFSTTEFVNEENYLEDRYFADTEDALAGAGATGLALAGAGAAGYGAKKKMDKYLAESSKKRKDAYNKAVEERVRGNKKYIAANKKVSKTIKDAVANPTNLVEEQANEAYEAALKARRVAREAAEKAAKSGKDAVKLQKAAGTERMLRRANLLVNKATKAVKGNKKLAAGIGAGTIAAGAGANMLRHRGDK